MSDSRRHIAIIAPPLAGHYDPLGVLAQALVARGHRATFFHVGDAAPLIAADGPGFVAIGGTRAPPGCLRRYVERLGRSDGPAGLMAMIRATAAISGLLLDELPEALARAGVDAVIADATEPAGALVARHLCLPFVASVTGLPLLRERAVPPAFTGWSYRADRLGLARNAVGAAVVDLLMAPIDRVVAHRAREWRLEAERDGGAPLLQIAQCPAEFDFPRAALPAGFHYAGPFRSPAIEPVDLPEDGRPLVYCSLGSLQGNRPALFAAMTRACAELGARAVVAHGGRLAAADARALPGDPLVAAFWPQAAVLPRCAAALVHGGFNTVLDALAAGVPIVAVPLAFEQPGTAARIAYHGAGLVVHRRRIGADRLRSRLARVLGEASHRRAAAALGRAIAAAGGAERAADLIDAAFSPAVGGPRAPSAAATTASPGSDDARDDSRRN